MAVPLTLKHQLEKSVTSFRGEYAFLSNFHVSPITVKAWRLIRPGAKGGEVASTLAGDKISQWCFHSITARTVEHGYQAYKARDISDATAILAAKTPGEAKRLGRRVALRSGWDECKEEVMLRLLRAKFGQNERVREKLKATANRILIEGNGWGDRYWGVCNGRGRNRLGVLLMQVRLEIQEDDRNEEHGIEGPWLL